MTQVVSLGSINLDRIRQVSHSEITGLEDRYDWFPERGQTVQIEELPPDFPTACNRIQHGGKGANQAVAAAKAGATTEMLGKVGSDHGEFGVISQLTDTGVGTPRIAATTEPTGTAYVFVGPTGDNWIIVRPGANDTIDSAYIRAQYETILSAECLLLQNEIPTEPVATLLSDIAGEPSRPIVILDPAPADGIEPLLRCDAVDFVTPNASEYQTLQHSLSEFSGVLVRKRGADGVVVEADEQFTVTPPSIRAVDTTGAGDVLNGFLAAQLAAGTPLQEAVEVGTIAASLSTREEGARGGIPTLEDVLTVRNSGGGSS